MKKYYAKANVERGVRILAFITRRYRDKFVEDYASRYDPSPLRRREIFKYLDESNPSMGTTYCLMPCFEAWTIPISGLVGEVATTDYRQTHVSRLRPRRNKSRE